MRPARLVPLRALAVAALAAGVSLGPAGRAAAQPAPAAPTFAIKPHHAGISVPNLEESIAWYRRMLGFEIVRRVAPSPTVSIALLRRDDCYIELFQVAGAEPLPESRRSPTADLGVHGIKHFAFQVADARAAAAELGAKGAEVVMGPIENATEIFFFVRDNSGNAFELIQYK
jgi:methylmalonyl-CoA/ethylmalonyl-CoA epimerase